MTISSFVKIKYLTAVLILTGFYIMTGCQSGKVLPDDIRAPASNEKLAAEPEGNSPKNEATASGSASGEHFQSEDPPIGGFGPDGDFRWEKYPRPPFSSFKYAPKYVPANTKSPGTAGKDTESRMTQVLDANKEFKDRLKERREKEAYLAQARPLIEQLKKDLVQVKKEEAHFLGQNLEFVEKRISKLTNAIGDVEISAYCLERLDQIEQEKGNPPESSPDESALEKEKTGLEYGVQFHQWRADRFREIADQVKNEYESIRLKNHSLWATHLRRKWQATKDSLSKNSKNQKDPDAPEKPFDPLDPIDLSEFKEFAQKMVSDPKNIESERVRGFLGHLLSLSVDSFSKQAKKGSSLVLKRSVLMDSKALQSTWAQGNLNQTGFYSNSDTTNLLGEFVRLPAGTFQPVQPAAMFQMGSPENEKDRSSDETQHEVTLSSFEVQAGAVTQEAYAEVMGVNPSHFQRKSDCPQSFKKMIVEGKKVSICSDYPVESITWDQAEQFAHRVTEHMKATGYRFELLSEAQQEYAFRGGTTTSYISGNDSSGLGDYVWYSANSGSRTHPVRSKKANSYGIYRSSVWEWSNDWYGPYTSLGIQHNPTGASSGSYRVIRGCSWYIDAGSCRSAQRSYYSPGNHLQNLGFRLLRTK